MKRCFRCKVVKAKSEFSRNASRKDGLQNYCKLCKRDADQANYLKNPQRKYKENYAHKQNIRWMIYNYLLTHPCVDCGESDPLFLEFDHVRGKKLHNIGDLNHQTKAWSLIEKEIAKCEVRCIKCHRIKTAKQFGWYKWLERFRQTTATAAK